MHHKRKKPKSSRAGCLLCKPWKHQRVAKYKRKSASSKRPLLSPRGAVEEQRSNAA